MVVWDWNQTWNENEVSWNVVLEWDWPAQNLHPLQGWSVVAPSSENAADSLFPYMASQHREQGLHLHILQSDWGCLGGRMPSSSNSRLVVQRGHLDYTSLHGWQMKLCSLTPRQTDRQTGKVSVTYLSGFSLQRPEMFRLPTHSGMLDTPRQIHLHVSWTNTDVWEHVDLQPYINKHLKHTQVGTIQLFL